MNLHDQSTLRCEEGNFESTTTISFPVRYRVRCPRCGADRRPGQDARYLCDSTDDNQSRACVTRSKHKRNEKVVADACDILARFRFGAPAALRVVN